MPNTKVSEYEFLEPEIIILNRSRVKDTPFSLLLNKAMNIFIMPSHPFLIFMEGDFQTNTIINKHNGFASNLLCISLAK